VVAMDAKAKTVTVESGISYGKLAPYLDSKAFALHNLASLPHISIAGACSTATHGSGEKNGNLSSAVAALEFVNAAGEVMKLSGETCTQQLGVPGPWYERLPHFRMGFTPSAGKELQSEFFVPRQNAVDAILAVEKLRDQITPHLMISEIRTIAADNLWMSPAYKQDSVTIHFTWKQDWPA